MQKKISKLNLFKQFANLDEYTGECRIVDKSEFIGDYSALYFTNGGDWCRRTTFAKAPNNYKFATATRTGRINLLWDANDDEKARVEEYFKAHCNFINSTNKVKDKTKDKIKDKTKDNKDNKDNIPTRCSLGIKYIKSFGKFESSSDTTRAIRNDILEFYKTQSCVGCGSNSELQCDHKNGLYNNLRVLNLETQTPEDFQSLCRHCNCQKRQVEKKTRETNKRYGATNIPHLRPFGINYIEGDETLDINNPNTLRGTYWYDPVAFTKYIHTQQLQQLINNTKPNDYDINLINKMKHMSISNKKKIIKKK